MNIAERAEYFARWRPDAIAVKTGEREVTWREMGETAARVAGGLRERGIARGDRVGILAMNRVEWCQLAIGVMHAGAIVVPLNIRLAPPELGLILEHSGCRAVAYDSTLAPLFAGAPKNGRELLTIGLDGEAEPELTFAELAGADPIPSAVTGSDDPAVLGYTSGTTGLPKGATLTHANIAACAAQTALAEGSTSERRTLMCVPLAFTGGIVNNFLTTFCVGGSLVMEAEFVPNRVLEVLESERITTLFAVPVMWQAIAAADGFANADLSALNTAVTGGAPVPGALLEAYLAKEVIIRQAYGLTEATGSCCMLPPERAVEKMLTAGLPNADTRVKLIDDDGGEVPTGEVGEICVMGPQVMAGYWNDAEATAEALDGEGWLHTGDLGRFDDEGMLAIVDRKKSMFISGGLNVYPAEIERIVDSLPEVEECAAFGLADERWGEVCAIVVRGREGAVDEEALIAHCREQLSDYKVPKRVLQADEPLPRGMSGKIQRNEIRERFG